MSPDPYIPIPAVIEDVTDETSNIRTFRLRPRSPLVFEAGQFIELTVPGIGEAAFTPSSPPRISETLELTIMRVGRVTEHLHALAPGTEVGIRGPLGKPYPLDAFRDREVLIVGGGVGLAPLRSLLYALFETPEQYRKIILRYGARTPGDLVYRTDLERCWGFDTIVDSYVTVDKGDDGWTGHEGVVTTILEPDCLTAHPDTGVAVVCGPPVMMKFTKLKLVDRGYPESSIYLSMEKNMSCGVGKCGHCRIGPYYACKDGPVFSYDRLKDIPTIWD